jgi:hypothetical protein
MFSRLSKGAFAQTKSLANTDVTSIPTTASSTNGEQVINKNIIIPTRLRPTDKRLRKIHLVNNMNANHEKSKNIYLEKQ